MVFASSALAKTVDWRVSLIASHGESSVSGILNDLSSCDAAIGES